MWLVRPARPDDLNDILHIVRIRGRGLSSTLPRDAQALAQRIDLSGRSFSGDLPKAEPGRFLFVLENSETKTVHGVSAIDARAGNGQPFYNYRRDTLIHASHELHISRRVDMLYPAHALTDCTLLCGFAIAADLVGTPAFELLSRARILFMAEHRPFFAGRSVVEIQGPQNRDGRVPFWDSLGRHFFDMDFETADQYSIMLSKTFIAELMPPNPIYVTLLTEAAQQAIGQAHSTARPACELLEREGFQPGCYVDIFDAGPVLEAETDQLVSVKSGLRKTLQSVEDLESPARTLAVGQGERFRCVLSAARDDGENGLIIPRSTADCLDCEPGDAVRVAELFGGAAKC